MSMTNLLLRGRVARPEVLRRAWAPWCTRCVTNRAPTRVEPGGGGGRLGVVLERRAAVQQPAVVGEQHLSGQSMNSTRSWARASTTSGASRARTWPAVSGWPAFS